MAFKQLEDSIQAILRRMGNTEKAATDAQRRADALESNVRTFTGTAAERAATTSRYWDKWIDTDGTQHTYVGDRAGGWRQYSGDGAVSAGTWANTSTTGIQSGARTVTEIIPTTLLAGESMLITFKGTGSGYGFITPNIIPTPTVNALVSFRQWQAFSTATNGFNFNWQIVRT